jgi:hypothetical protein
VINFSSCNILFAKAFIQFSKKKKIEKKKKSGKTKSEEIFSEKKRNNKRLQHCEKYYPDRLLIEGFLLSPENFASGVVAIFKYKQTINIPFYVLKEHLKIREISCVCLTLSVL